MPKEAGLRARTKLLFLYRHLVSSASQNEEASAQACAPYCGSAARNGAIDWVLMSWDEKTQPLKVHVTDRSKTCQVCRCRMRPKGASKTHSHSIVPLVAIKNHISVPSPLVYKGICHDTGPLSGPPSAINQHTIPAPSS